MTIDVFFFISSLCSLSYLRFITYDSTDLDLSDYIPDHFSKFLSGIFSYLDLVITRNRLNEFTCIWRMVCLAPCISVPVK